MTPTRSDDDNSDGNGGKIGENNVDGKIDDGPTYTTTLRATHEGFAQPAPPLYSSEQEAYLHSVQHDAANLFPQGEVFSSLQELRDDLAKFGNVKGFAVTTVGFKLCCTKCPELTSQKKRREERNTSVPVERRRTFKSSTCCDCPFKITYRMVQKSDKSNKFVVLTGSCIYRHEKGC
jgi:hypothetical protein